MTSLDDELKVALHRNILLGMWAAAELGLADQSAEAYAKQLAMGTLDKGSDAFTKIRNDFHAAGIAKTDEQILRVMETLMLQALGQVRTARGSNVDAAEVAIKRKITSR